MKHNNSYIELNTEALRHNLKFLKKHFNKNVIVSSVVKGNAYGHEIETFVPLAFSQGLRHFSVFDSSEAMRVHQIVGSKATIMIMGWVAESDLEWVIKNDIELYVSDFARLESTLKICKLLKKQSLIHIEVETGMNRTGFGFNALNRLFIVLKKNAQHFKIKGICTHFAGAESIANYYRIQNQIIAFESFYKRFVEADCKPEIKHSACSAAAMMYPQTQMDLVRIGIMQYGFWPSAEVMVNFLNNKMKTPNPLKRVISWKSSVMSIKKVKRGEFIGYGTSFMADDNMQIAVVPVGYAHGYSRSLSNLGRVLIHGERCLVVGSVNMNMILVDISLLENVKILDEVVLIGTQHTQSITVASFSDYSNLLNYELLTRLSKEIPRKVV